MQAFYKRFDLFLNIVFILTCIIVVASIVIFFYGNQLSGILNNLPSNFMEIFGSVITFWFLSLWLFNLIYIIAGIILIANGIRKKKNEKKSLGKKLLIKGLIMGIVVFMLFSIMSLALSVFGIHSQPLVLPNMPNTSESAGDPHNPSTGFPLQELQIIGVKDQKGNPYGCDIIIQNFSASQSATNISVIDDGTENDDLSGSSPLGPGKTLSAQVAIDGNSNKNACSDVSIHDAGIATNE